MHEDNCVPRRRIAEQLLGVELSPEGFAPCPGQDLHTSPNGSRDFRVTLDGAPTGFCFHAACSPRVEAFNAELRRRIGRAEHGDRPPAERCEDDGIPPEPQAPKRPKRPPFNPAKLAEFAARCPQAVSPEWLRQRSPIWIPVFGNQSRETAELFLHALFRADERVLVFTRYWSQGDFLWHSRTGTFRLGEAQQAKPVPSPLPSGGPEGVWYLCQPVSGEWCANPYTFHADGPPRYGRRHGGCVAAWRHLVLESDTADASLWLSALVQLPIPLVAIYTSGGKSIHGLVRVDARSKCEWDSLRNDLLPVLCPLGADPAAMTAVRLTRLPGMLRHGTRGKDGKPLRYPRPRMQELVWLNPAAPTRPILDLV